MIIVIISFVIVTLAILQIRWINENAEMIYNHPFKVSNTVRDIKVNINAIHRSMKDVATAENEDQLNKSVAIVNNYDSLIHDAFKLFKNVF